MEPQHSQQPRPQHPHLHTFLPALSSPFAYRTAESTPVTSPGLFSPTSTRPITFPAVSEGATPNAGVSSPYLHPLQERKVRETHKALVTSFSTGRKLINHYEIIEELGRGVHGKVKLAKDLETNENVAIKIIPRFSKRRRLGKVTAMSTQDKSRREIAILKKMRHPNIVALLEVIDDPELKKIYMVLEHVELGEIVWRKKGLPHICSYERRRVERQMRGQRPTEEEEKYELTLERRQAAKDAKRAKLLADQQGHAEYWSLEYAGVDDDDTDYNPHSYDGAGMAIPSYPNSIAGSRIASQPPSRNLSYQSVAGAAAGDFVMNEDDLETPGPLLSNPASSTALDGPMCGACDDPSFGGRSPSMPDSIISHMSSIDYNRSVDPFADDYSYVPCFTMEQARIAFRDTVLGLEYLHYEGVVHRDIKPANLLWTRDHRIKISDFGVSYFGRPIRDGETDETISESEARDFDNDLELAKTVGTPAFFAPELCYTEGIDYWPGQPQPKVTEQIDVWSLGVTLYCLIFARIPFLAEDEWQMFRKIATEDVFIPTKRLRPVDAATKPIGNLLYTRIGQPPFRDEGDLAYEEIDGDLYDLLKRMLTKPPEQRIKLKDVKRHPWVVMGIDNVPAWLEDTEPARRTSGQKIQVDAREMEHAVVPLTFLERARSVVKKAVGKVIHPLGDRAESSSRKRATSSAASSAGDSPSNPPSTPHLRESRRGSLRGDVRADDYFANPRDHQPSGEHPLSQSVTASPYGSPDDAETSTTDPTAHCLADPVPVGLAPSDPSAIRQTARASVQNPMPRHAHSRSISNAILSLHPTLYESRTASSTPAFEATDDRCNTSKYTRNGRSGADDYSRARSVDRGLFAGHGQRGETRAAFSSSPQAPEVPRIRDYQRGQPLPGSKTCGRHRASTDLSKASTDLSKASTDLSKKPKPAQELGDVPAARPPSQLGLVAGPEEHERMIHREDFGADGRIERGHFHYPRPSASADPALIPCPPSPPPDGSAHHPSLRSRDDAIGTAISSSSASMDVLNTPLTSPSETMSPVSHSNPALAKECVFQSNPSLPALLSSTSSVSADLEGEFLGNPGVVPRNSVLDTSESLTPPAMAKEPISGFPLEAHELLAQGAVPLRLSHDSARRPLSVTRSAAGSPRFFNDDDDADSESDEGLTMAKPKKHQRKVSTPVSMGRAIKSSKRRDTNVSIGSTETAKKLVINSG